MSWMSTPMMWTCKSQWSRCMSWPILRWGLLMYQKRSWSTWSVFTTPSSNIWLTLRWSVFIDCWENTQNSWHKSSPTCFTVITWSMKRNRSRRSFGSLEPLLNRLMKHHTFWRITLKVMRSSQSYMKKWRKWFWRKLSRRLWKGHLRH